MTADNLSEICRAALSKERYVKLVHRGVERDVYPYRIRDGRLYCYCTIHPDRDVESMWLTNISSAWVSENELGMIFNFDSDFAS
jgi:hypothetical protein